MQGPARRIGHYRVLQRIGRSGGDRGEVLLATTDGPLGFVRDVVLKRRRLDRPYEASLLAREARICARLVHPAVVRIYDFFEEDGYLVMVREHVPGLSLDELVTALSLRAEPLPDAAALYVAERVFCALAAAHGARDTNTGEYAPIIHRDVTPSNVLISWDGHVKLSDFGFAKVCGRTSQTASGLLKGSYGYMAPEQILGEPVTVRADIYSGALVLREMLTGEIAFPRGDLPELEYLRTMAEPRLAPIERARPDLPVSLATALGRALTPDADARAMTAELMQSVLCEELTDVESGRALLVATLARIRNVRADRPGLDEMTSNARAARRKLLLPQHRTALQPHSTPAPLVSAIAPSQTPAPNRLHAPLSLALVTAAAITLISVTRHRPVSTQIAPAALAHPSASRPPEEPAKAPTIEAPRPTTGRVHTPLSAKPFRVFVDGKFACSGGATLVLTCGTHTIKIGSVGKTRIIAVPCGGDVSVMPRW